MPFRGQRNPKAFTYSGEKNCFAESTFLRHAVMSTELGEKNRRVLLSFPICLKHSHTGMHTHPRACTHMRAHICTLSAPTQLRPALAWIWDRSSARGSRSRPRKAGRRGGRRQARPRVGPPRGLPLCAVCPWASCPSRRASSSADLGSLSPPQMPTVTCTDPEEAKSSCKKGPDPPENGSGPPRPCSRQVHAPTPTPSLRLGFPGIFLPSATLLCTSSAHTATLGGLRGQGLAVGGWPQEPPHSRG